jgi:hypothetical protein
VSEQEKTQSELIQAAVAWLAGQLPASWRVERSKRAIVSPGGGEPRALDAAIDLTAPNHTGVTILVEARSELAPRDVDELFGGLAGALRLMTSNVPVIVVAPWLSARAQARLAAEDVNYLDLTGNALIRVEHPTLFLRSAGATRNPAPAPVRGPARLRGPRAARLIRLLADVRPPYGLRALAEATHLTPGYVSRLLDALDREALIERDPRGPVRSVDVPGLLRHWAGSYDVFASNDTTTLLAPEGPAALLREIPPHLRLAVTGSFAAARHAPVAAPAQLLLYSEEDPFEVAGQLGLLPSEESGNVVLLDPFDPFVWGRGEREDGLYYAAPSQVAVDCLTGNGRMPAEGEALLAWMVEHEGEWRADALEEAR